MSSTSSPLSHPLALRISLSATSPTSCAPARGMRRSGPERRRQAVLQRARDLRERGRQAKRRHSSSARRAARAAPAAPKAPLPARHGMSDVDWNNLKHLPAGLKRGYGAWDCDANALIPPEREVRPPPGRKPAQRPAPRAQCNTSLRFTVATPRRALRQSMGRPNAAQKAWMRLCTCETLPLLGRDSRGSARCRRVLPSLRGGMCQGTPEAHKVPQRAWITRRASHWTVAVPPSGGFLGTLVVARPGLGIGRPAHVSDAQEASRWAARAME